MSGVGSRELSLYLSKKCYHKRQRLVIPVSGVVQKAGATGKSSAVVGSDFRRSGNKKQGARRQYKSAEVDTNPGARDGNGVGVSVRRRQVTHAEGGMTGQPSLSDQMAFLCGHWAWE